MLFIKLAPTRIRILGNWRLLMAQFMLLIDGATSDQMEHILRIESESDGHLSYVPVESGMEGVTTRIAIEEELHAPNAARSEVYRGICIKRDDFGVASAIQVLELFSFRSVSS